MKRNNKHTPSVAVITRTKDRAILLDRAIKSVHNQSMRDFIHVIINDAGDQEVVDALVRKHSKIIDGRVKVIHNTTSNGMEAASNKAIKSVDSLFVAIHDDDDTWHPDFLEKTTELLSNTGGKGVVVTTDRVIEKIEGGKVLHISTDRWLPELRNISLYKQCRDNYATPITFLYRREVLDKIGYYDEGLPVAGDWDFALRFLMEYDIEFLKTPHALAFYHHRPSTTGVDANSVFQDSGAKHKFYMNLLANKYLRKELKTGRLGVGYLMSALTDQRTQNELVTTKLTEEVARTGQELEDRVSIAHDSLVDIVVKRTSLKSRIKSIIKHS